MVFPLPTHDMAYVMTRIAESFISVRPASSERQAFEATNTGLVRSTP